MSRQVVVRGIPEGDLDLLDRAKPPGVSREEYLRSIISEAVHGPDPAQISLFEGAIEPKRVFGTVPFRFIDLFAGIGGFRAALTKLGGDCVWSSEWDRFSATTYAAWYGDEPDTRDIRVIAKNAPSEVPDHDVLAAGFPCQPFSLAGVSKKNSLGRPHGFDDEHQGNLFFAILDVVDAKRPPVLFLENVKNLRSHERGNTWRVICSSLEERGYAVHDEIIDAIRWVPQHRERIFIVAFDTTVFGDRQQIGFEFPKAPTGQPRLGAILEDEPDSKDMLSDRLWQYLRDYKSKHEAKGNGFGYGIAHRDGTTRTISARYHKDGSEILVEEPGWKNPRRLSPNEAKLLMGFDETYAELFGHSEGFPQVVSDTQAYRQFGNAVVPKVVEAVGAGIVSVMAGAVGRTGTGCLIKGRRLAS